MICLEKKLLIVCSFLILISIAPLYGMQEKALVNYTLIYAWNGQIEMIQQALSKAHEEKVDEHILTCDDNKAIFNFNTEEVTLIKKNVQAHFTINYFLLSLSDMNEVNCNHDYGLTSISQSIKNLKEKANNWDFVLL